MEAAARTLWASQPVGLTATERCILLYLAGMADAAGNVITKRQDLAAITGTGEQAVTRAIATLASRGIVKRGPSSKAGATISLVGNSNSGIWPPITSALAASGEPPIHQNGCSSGPYPHSHRLVVSDQERPILVASDQGGGAVPSRQRLGMGSRVEYSFLLASPSLTFLNPPTPPKILATPEQPPSPARPVIVQPKRAPNSQTDLLGAPVAVDENQLMQAAVRTWIDWQTTIGRAKPLKITPARTRRFMAAWETTLHRNMTNWRIVCRRCTRNALLAGKAGSWEGASFDWVMWKNHLAEILEGQKYPENFEPAAQPGAA